MIKIHFSFALVRPFFSKTSFGGPSFLYFIFFADFGDKTADSLEKILIPCYFNWQFTTEELVMFNIPVTYLFDFEVVSPAARPYIMQEFADCGAEHLVLSDTLVKMITDNPALADTLQKEMAENNLSFCDAHAPFGVYYDMHCPFPAMRKMMFARQKLTLEICAYMHVDTVTIHLGSTRVAPTDEIPVAVHLERVRETLSELLPYAEKLGITVCIENSWYPLCTPENLLMLKAEFPSPNLGFCYDAGHANIMDNGRKYSSGKAYDGWKTAGFNCTPPWENRALEKMLPHIVNCHLHDNMGDFDTHTLPGKGNVNWNHILGTLALAPKLRVIQCEVIPAANMVPISALTAFFSNVKISRDSQ